MNTLEMARAAGFVILLDGKIGQEAYHSVTGSLRALERFEALCRETRCKTSHANEGRAPDGSADARLPLEEACRS